VLKPDDGMERYRIEVGKRHNTKPGNIVGAIANEAGIDSEFIGKIKIHEDYSTVDLPEEIPQNILSILKNIRVSGQKLNISKMTDFIEKKDRKKRRGAKKSDKNKKTR
jgi:ATP-dependent RNA helicase DeaD